MPKKTDNTDDRAVAPQGRPDNGSRVDFPFCGAEANPVFGDDRHCGRDTTYLEVSPEELIDVAKHLAGPGIGHRESVERAYRLICEAHLISGNIQLWNEKARRHHSSEAIFNLVDQAQKNQRGQPLRQGLLVAFFESLGLGRDATNAAKRFNEWLRQATRLKDYLASVPWNPQMENYDNDIHKQLVKNQWIKWFRIGSAGYIILPSRTQPAKKAPRKLKEGEHVTTPFWSTSDVWWPEADEEEVEHRKSEYLSKSRDAFLSDHHARKALEKFGRWLDLEQQMRAEAKPTKSSKRPRNNNGAFVSVRDKGSDRGSEGQFQKKIGE